MIKKIKETKEARAALVDEQRKLVDTADKEKREFSAEEETRYQAIDADFEAMTDQITDLEKQVQERTVRLDALAKREDDLKRAGKPVADRVSDPQDKKADDNRSQDYSEAFNRALVHGLSSLSRDEQRALSAGTQSEGGYLVVPEAFMTSFIQAVDNIAFVRQRATVIQVPNAASLGVPSLDSDPSDAEWTGELSGGNVDTDMSFGKRTLTPTPVKKLVKVSEKLVRIAPQNIDALIRARLAYKFGITHEKAFLTGPGDSGQPLGLFTASAKGITTARDVATDNIATAIKPDGLINAKYALKPQYHTKAEWIFHRDAVKMIRKMKDGNGDYLWKQGFGDKSDTILEVPYHMSEYAPNTFTTGLYAGLLGDLSFYWIADALAMTIKVADQLYMESGQIGYFGNLESDGMPVLEEAFVRIKLG